MQEKILTPDQVAQILQVHPFTVLKFIKQGRLKASKLGRVYRIRESDLEGFLNQTASREKKTEEDVTNTIKKSKNKNKVPLNKQIEPNLTADATLEPEITVTKVEIIESTEQESANKGGDDQYYLLQ